MPSSIKRCPRFTFTTIPYPDNVTVPSRPGRISAIGKLLVLIRFLRIRTSTQLGGEGFDSQRFVVREKLIYIRSMILVIPILSGNRIRQLASPNFRFCFEHAVDSRL